LAREVVLELASINVFSEINEQWVEFFPTLISSTTILLIGIVLAFFVRFVVVFLVNAGVRSFGQKISQIESAKVGLKSLAKTSGQITFSLVLFLTIASVLKRLGLEVVSTWLEYLSQYLPNVIAAIIICYVGWKFKEFVEVILPESFKKLGIAYSTIISKILGWTVFITAALISLDQIGVDMRLLVTFVSIVGGVTAGGVVLTFALGAKGTISDILNCFQLQRIVRKGNTVRIGEIKGDVLSVGPVFVLLNTEGGKVAFSGTRIKSELIQVVSSEETK